MKPQGSSTGGAFETLGVKPASKMEKSHNEVYSSSPTSAVSSTPTMHIRAVSTKSRFSTRKKRTSEINWSPPQRQKKSRFQVMPTPGTAHTTETKPQTSARPAPAFAQERIASPPATVSQSPNPQATLVFTHRDVSPEKLRLMLTRYMLL